MTRQPIEYRDDGSAWECCPECGGDREFESMPDRHWGVTVSKCLMCEGTGSIEIPQQKEAAQGDGELE